MKKFVLFLAALTAFAVVAMAAQLGPWVIDGSSGLGFPLNTFFNKVGCAVQYGSVINLISNGENQSGGFWTKVPLPTREFTCIVGIEVHPRPRSVRSADGFTIVISRNIGLGEHGEGLGYSGQIRDYPPLNQSFASVFKFFAVRPNEERVEHSYGGYFMNGERIPRIPEQSSRFVDLSARGLELANGHFLAITLQYRSGILNTVVDDLTTGVWVSYYTSVDLPRLLGEYACVGVTAGTGAEVATFKVHGFVWSDSGHPSVVGMKTVDDVGTEGGLGLSFFKVPAEPRKPATEPPIWLSGPWE